MATSADILILPTGRLSTPLSQITNVNSTSRAAKDAAPCYQRVKAVSSSSLAATQIAPSCPISFFQNGARDFR